MTELPLIFGGTPWERASPPGASTLITSAPSSPSSLVAHGPTAATVRSKIRIPSRIPAMRIASCRVSAGARPELRERYLIGDVVVHNLDRHPDPYLVVLNANQIGENARPFVEFDLGDVVRNIAVETSEIRLMENYPGVHTAVSAEPGPGEVARPATRTQRRRRIPYLAARVASLEFELAIFEPVPIGLVERGNQWQRLLILRFRHDYLRRLLHMLFVEIYGCARP